MNSFSGSSVTTPQSASIVRGFLNRTYSWMFAGMALTAIIAYLTSQNQPLMDTLRGFGFGIVLLQLGVVFFLSFMVQRVSATIAGLLFMAYAALTGLTFSYLLIAYTGSSVVGAFAASALTFGAMSLIGYTTKRDLSGLGRFFLFALIGLIIASIVNIFVASGPFGFIISIVGVLLFAGLTAYDTQRLKEIALSGQGTENLAIYGALQLYLDFINIFLFILRLGGSRN